MSKSKHRSRRRTSAAHAQSLAAPKKSNLPLIVGGVVVLAAVGVGIYFLTRPSAVRVPGSTALPGTPPGPEPTPQQQASQPSTPAQVQQATQEVQRLLPPEPVLSTTGPTGPTGAPGTPAFTPDPAPGVITPVTPARGTITAAQVTLRAAQRYLIALGVNLGPSGADGRAGPLTHAALTAYQTSRHLTADGVLGPATKAKLAADINQSQDPLSFIA